MWKWFQTVRFTSIPVIEAVEPSRLLSVICCTVSSLLVALDSGLTLSWNWNRMFLFLPHLIFFVFVVFLLQLNEMISYCLDLCLLRLRSLGGLEQSRNLSPLLCRRFTMLFWSLISIGRAIIINAQGRNEAPADFKTLFPTIQMDFFNPGGLQRLSQPDQWEPINWSVQIAA